MVHDASGGNEAIPPLSSFRSPFARSRCTLPGMGSRVNLSGTKWAKQRPRSDLSLSVNTKIAEDSIMFNDGQLRDQRFPFFRLPGAPRRRTNRLARPQRRGTRPGEEL